MGKQMAIELARHGADVAVAARTSVPSESKLPGTIRATVDEIRAVGRRAEAIKVDLQSDADIDAMVTSALDVFGHIDIFVYSVQYHGPGYWDSFFDTTIEQIDAQMRVNALAAVRICKLVVPQMATRGSGVIVLVTSGAGIRDRGTPPGQGSTGLGYPISKAALCRFIPALAKEVKDLGIAVMGLSPGMVFSEHVEAAAVGKDLYGMNTDLAVPTSVPARALGFLCTSDDPMAYTGMDLLSSELYVRHSLGPIDDDLRKAVAIYIESVPNLQRGGS
jgi:NAD(P)-dependent dehydrogenase (short-subunit alcohol dehydrogenase family)